jgi:TonB family protein
LSPHPDSPAVPEPLGFVEQRLFLRKKVETPLPIELLPGKEVWLHDLGEGGLSVSGSSRLEPGTPTFLDFQFPDSNSVIEAAGLVAWCDNFGRVGVRFTRIKPDSTAALKRWLKSDQASARDEEAETTSPIPPLSTLVSRAHFEISDLRAELASGSLSNEAALKLIAERMAYHTRATGAAVAWREGNDVICRASTGNAPEIGVRLNIDTGLSGECYRTGNIVSMADSEHDSRVDPEVCRQLDFRSLLIVPVASADDVIVGVAEVFSSVPGNFEGGDVLLLSSIAELIGDLYDKNQLSSSPVEALASVLPKEQAKSPDSDDAGRRPDLPAPQVQTAPAPFVPAGFELADQKSEREFTASNQEQAKSSATEHAFEQDRDEDKSHGPNWNTRRILLGALLLIGGVGVGDYVNWRLSRPHSSASPPNRIAYQLASAPVSSVSQLQPAEATSPQTSTSEPSSAVQVVASIPNRAAARKVATPDDSVESNFTTGLAGHRHQSELAPDAPSIPASNQAPFRVDTTYFLPTKVSQVRLLNASLPASQVTTGRLLHRVNPVFPAFAKAAGIRGSVVIAATIGRDGRLKNMKLISGNGALAVEAFRAARQWVYAPYRLNGQPIEVDARIVMDFGRQ